MVEVVELAATESSCLVELESARRIHGFVTSSGTSRLERSTSIRGGVIVDGGRYMRKTFEMKLQRSAESGFAKKRHVNFVCVSFR